MIVCVQQEQQQQQQQQHQLLASNAKLLPSQWQHAHYHAPAADLWQSSPTFPSSSTNSPTRTPQESMRGQGGHTGQAATKYPHRPTGSAGMSEGRKVGPAVGAWAGVYPESSSSATLYSPWQPQPQPQQPPCALLAFVKLGQLDKVHMSKFEGMRLASLTCHINSVIQVCVCLCVCVSVCV